MKLADLKEAKKKFIKMPELQKMVKASKTVRSMNTLGRDSKSSNDWGQMHAEVIIPKKVDPKDKTGIEKAKNFAKREMKKAFKGQKLEIKQLFVGGTDKNYNLKPRVVGQPEASTVLVIFNFDGHPHFDNKEISKRDPDYMAK